MIPLTISVLINLGLIVSVVVLFKKKKAVLEEKAVTADWNISIPVGVDKEMFVSYCRLFYDDKNFSTLVDMINYTIVNGLIHSKITGEEAKLILMGVEFFRENLQNFRNMAELKNGK